jgi:hypothetical protein
MYDFSQKKILVLSKGESSIKKQKGFVERWMFSQENILILSRYKGLIKKKLVLPRGVKGLIKK